ncbi:hypothetical protein BGX21_010943 [Mortierella sp. AD011]|nr:hypothetical protein BGX21_010943 [Mortierella sp. AD011]
MSRGGGRGGGGGRGRGGGTPGITMFGPDAIQATFKNPGETYPDIVLPIARPASDEESVMFIAMKKLQDTLYSSPYYLTEPKKPGKRKVVKRNIDFDKLGENEEDDEADEEIDPETGLPKKTGDGDEDVEEEDYEDEEDAEGNDYNDTYFDNGENDVDLDMDEDAVEY